MASTKKIRVGLSIEAAGLGLKSKLRRVEVERLLFDAGVVFRNKSEGSFHPAAAGTTTAAFGCEEEALGRKDTEPAGGPEAGPVGLLFGCFRPEGEADVDPPIKKPIGGSHGSGALGFGSVVVVEGFAVGK